MITAIFKVPNPRQHIISFALFQPDQDAEPDMVFAAFETHTDLPPLPAANSRSIAA